MTTLDHDQDILDMDVDAILAAAGANVSIEEVEHQCGNPGCSRKAKYHLDYGIDGMLRCARHLGSMVIFVLDDRQSVTVTRL